MSWRISSLALSLFFSFLQQLQFAAQAQTLMQEAFPGKGNEQNWKQACEVCDQGIQLFHMQRFSEASKLFEKAMEIYSFDSLFSYGAGLAHQSNAYLTQAQGEKKAELEQAEKFFDLSTKLKADRFDCWIHIANVQSELQEYEKSLQSLQTALAIPGVSDMDKAQTQSALQFVKSKMDERNQSTQASPSAQVSQSVSANGSGVVARSGWQSYSNPASGIVMQYPDGWQLSSDPKSGRIDVVHNDGSRLSVLPFAIGESINKDNASTFLKALLRAFAPDKKWTDIEAVGANSYRSTARDEKEGSAAALVLTALPRGTFGKLCIATLPKTAKQDNNAAFAEMLNSLRFTGNSPQQAVPDQAAQQILDRTAQQIPGKDAQEVPEQTAQQLTAEQQMAMLQQPKTWQNMNQSGLPATTFSGYTTFVDPSEHSFEVEVPVGWKAEGGLTRRSAIDVRPWVRVTSPDQLIVAFIGDGALPSFTMPTAMLSQLGFGTGRAYNGSIVKPYVPASKFIQSYVHEKLNTVLDGIQIVDQNEHPDFAREVNGTVGATRSECSSVKISGAYKGYPAVGYFIAATKATVMSGTGMWWVTYVAGELSPADRDAAGLSVILHMMQTFHLDPQWQGQSLRTTAEVSSNYRQASQQISKSITDRYWSQQAFNDRMNQSYWNRQAAQDHAANNFSDYIRGTQTVQDPQSGQQYKVDYGPQYHWVDPSGNVIGTKYSSPGPEWQQLIAVP